MSLVTLESFELHENVSTSLLAFIPEEQKELLQDSLDLLRLHAACEKHRDEKCDCEICKSLRPFHDYSFIVFPLGKAYEGFLKFYFWKLKIISEQRYRSRQLRIGRSFNPDLPSRFRDEEWLFDDVVRLCSVDVAQQLWRAWLNDRNHLFHYFPDDRYNLSLDDARSAVREILTAMEEAVACKIQHDGVLT